MAVAHQRLPSCCFSSLRREHCACPVKSYVASAQEKPRRGRDIDINACASCRPIISCFIGEGQHATLTRLALVEGVKGSRQNIEAR